MKDLRKSMNVNGSKTTESRITFKPFKWLKRNWKNITFIVIMFISFNLVFNPGGVSRFLSSWIHEFISNWN